MSINMGLIANPPIFTLCSPEYLIYLILNIFSESTNCFVFSKTLYCFNFLKLLVGDTLLSEPVWLFVKLKFKSLDHQKSN